MRVLVCGGRDYKNVERITAVLKHLHPSVTIIHGAAKGADTLAGGVAATQGLLVEAYPANWSAYGMAAGAMRNQQMLDTGVDLVIAFPGGKGTADMTTRARDADVPVLVVI